MNKDSKLPLDIDDSLKGSLVVPLEVDATDVGASTSATPLAKEINGPKGLEPTRYGDWEAKGRCFDF